MDDFRVDDAAGSGGDCVWGRHGLPTLDDEVVEVEVRDLSSGLKFPWFRPSVVISSSFF